MHPIRVAISIGNFKNISINHRNHSTGDTLKPDAIHKDYSVYNTKPSQAKSSQIMALFNIHFVKKINEVTNSRQSNKKKKYKKP